MSRDDRDKRGGHFNGSDHDKNCGWCKRQKIGKAGGLTDNRTRREREALKQEARP